VLKDMIDKYAWVNDIEAWTVAVVSGQPADEVVRIYGGDPASPVGDYFFAQARDLQGGAYPDPLRFHLQVLSHGDHVVALENNGWSGSVPEIARRCSAHGGHFFSVYWNVNAFGMLVEAIDGKVTAYFESLYPIAPEPPQSGEVRPAWAVGPETEPGAAWPTCLALMQQQTGLAFDQRWLSTPLPTYGIPDPDELLKDVENARVP
jgi:hypothetical protein